MTSLKLQGTSCRHHGVVRGRGLRSIVLGQGLALPSYPKAHVNHRGALGQSAWHQAPCTGVVGSSARGCRGVPCHARLAHQEEVALEAGEVLSERRYEDGGLTVRVTRNAAGYQVDVEASEARPRLLHWAVDDWTLPPQACWPEGTEQAGDKAVQTPFADGRRVRITFPAAAAAWRLVFVVKELEPEQWLNNGGSDYAAQLRPPPPSAPTPAPQAAAPATASENGAGELLSQTRSDDGISIRVTRQEATFEVLVEAETPRPMLMHWGVNEWQVPPAEVWPPNTVQAGDKAVQTPFAGGRQVRLSFPANTAPERLVFVLKELQPEQWLNNGGANYAAQLRPPGVEDTVAKVLDAEAHYSNWGLHNRFCLANDTLDAFDAAGPVGMAFVLVWLRLSSNKQLAWYRNASYQSKDIAHMQKVITQRIVDKARLAKDPGVRRLARLTLAGLPRGGGDGDAIRLGILNIMRENGIREGHRPGIEDKFLEQWHQKLHTNTSPEDITICEAYLAFLASGDIGEFWRVAWENGRITPEHLRTMDKAITADPLHLPQLMGPFQHYLWILKTTHAGADMDVCLEMAKGHLDDGLRWDLYDVLSHRNEWWVPGKLVDTRARLEHVWRENGARDLLMLDVALEAYFRLAIERMDKSRLTGDDLVDLVHLVLRSGCIAADSTDLGQCTALWEKVRGQERWSREWALRALAATQRTSLALSAFMDDIYGLVQPHAQRFGEECGIDPKYIVNFGEEVVRGHPLFVLGLLLQPLEPMLRAAAGVPPWQVVSQAAASGQVVALDSLAEVQGAHSDVRQVVVAQQVGGNEDIPPHIAAVLTASSTDVLSHVAIRARAQGVLLATCFDAEQLDAIRQLAGQEVSVSVDPTGAVTATPAPSGGAAGAAKGKGKAKAKAAAPAVTLGATRKTERWALTEDAFEEGLVGGKSRNLAALRGRLPPGTRLPSSVALPFGTFERALAAPANHQVAARVAHLEAQVDSRSAGQAGVPPQLAELRSVISSGLAAPEALRKELAAAAKSAGLIPEGAWAEGSPAWNEAWGAICRVWASKWTDRAWLSRRAQRVRDADLRMACLLQQVVPAEYAFVAHTANPITRQRGELFGEVVVGMGEALVGNTPGRALAFTASGEGGEPALVSMPSKRVALRAASGANALIARSDSNGEDLEAYAGAGLYDSVPLQPLQAHTIDYANEPLVWDDAFRSQLLAGIAKLGRATDAAFGGTPQDIEGVWAGGELTIVQSRPQVL